MHLNTWAQWGCLSRLYYHCAEDFSEPGYPLYGTKHIRSNLDTVMFNKNTLRYFFVLCTLWMSKHLDTVYTYVQVQYLCFHNYFNLHTGSEVPDDFLSVTGSKLSASFSCTCFWPKPAESCLLLAAKGEAAGFSCFSTVGAELNFTCSFFPFKNKHYLLEKRKPGGYRTRCLLFQGMELPKGGGFFAKQTLVLWTNKGLPLWEGLSMALW